MDYLRLYVDQAGETHFAPHHAEMTVQDFAPPAAGVAVSGPEAASSVRFLSVPGLWRGGWHPSPGRHLLIMLGGLAEFEASDGEVRRLVAGDVLLLEDTQGKGHDSRAVSGQPVTCVMVLLD